MRDRSFELCAESLEACLAARDGGATRIELCSALSEGGLTPSHGLVSRAVRVSGVPVYPMVRPRGGPFVYSDEEYEAMALDVLHLRELGAGGVVLGLLRADGSVDVARTSELVAMAGPLEVTFHRAFDCTGDLSVALEDVIATGCTRVLTSGGRPSVVEGAVAIRRLVEQSAGRIGVMAGGGLRLSHAAEVARVTGAAAFHGSVRRRTTGDGYARLPGDGDGLSYTVKAEDIRAMIAEIDAGTRGVTGCADAMRMGRVRRRRPSGCR